MTRRHCHSFGSKGAFRPRRHDKDQVAAITLLPGHCADPIVIAAKRPGGPLSDLSQGVSCDSCFALKSDPGQLQC